MWKLSYFGVIWILILASSQCEGTSSPDQPSLEKYIIHGNIARKGQFPGAVALKDSRTGETFCGGTILSPNWIISSAKCLKQQNFKSGKKSYGFLVMVGDLKNKDLHEYPKQKLKNVTFIAIHPSYPIHTNLFMSDLSLIRIDPCIAFVKNHSEPIQLVKNVVADGEQCEIAGWGTYDLKNKGKRSTRLRYMETRYLTHDTCISDLDKSINKYPKINLIDVVCSTSDNVTKATCDGDEGAGLICNGGLAGVLTSEIASCGAVGNIASYTDVFHEKNKKWIEKTMKDNHVECAEYTTVTPDSDEEGVCKCCSGSQQVTYSSVLTLFFTIVLYRFR